MLKALIFSEWNTKHLIRNAKQTLQWRRSKVLELSSEGRSQADISRILKVSVATINTDMQYLKEEAKENIKRYINERLPFEFHKCLVGLDSIVCKMSDIINSTESNGRDVLQATSVKMQAYAMKIDLLSNATVVEKAVQFVEGITQSNMGDYE
jgi:Sigma-70, region 4